MHKKLAADLTSLAHSILQMKNKEDVFALKTKAHEVYEKLAVLACVEEYFNTTSNPEHTKEELLDLVKKVGEKSDNTIETENIEETISLSEESEVDDLITKTEVKCEKCNHQWEIESDDSEKYLCHSCGWDSQKGEYDFDAFDSWQEKMGLNEELDDLFSQSDEVIDEAFEDELEAVEPNNEEITLSLEDELKDTIAADVVADLFENAPKKSLNDKIRDDIQIGLNDRIAFVKNLFGGSQEDFNRVVSQLNSFKTEKEAKKFINKMVKPDYNWAENEDIEQRFMSIVERKFL